MLLFQHANTVRDGTLGPCLRTYENSTLVAAWAPGTGDMISPDDVGLQLSATGYTLQVHYNGTGTDRSGLEVCYATASGVCRPSSAQPIHTLNY
jgi:hypothetical protein